MLNCNKVIVSCATAVFALLCGCTSGEGEGLSDKSGRIKLSVTADKTIEQISSRSAEGPDMSFLESLSAQDLALVLQSTEGASYSRKWSSVSEFPTEEKFPVGSYMVTAYYGETDAEGFDKPLLFGTTDFSVIADRETQVSLTATIANSIVYLETTENFRNYFQSYALSIVTPRGYNINIANDEMRPVYVNPGTVTINASVILPSGKRGNINLGRFTAKAATLERVTLNVENNAGDAVLTVTFDETLADEQITLDLSEDLFNAAEPEIIPEGFDAKNNSFTFTEGAFESTYEDGCAINIAAQAGLAAATLTIDGQAYNLLKSEKRDELRELGVKLINFDTEKSTDKVTLAKINLKDYFNRLTTPDMFTPSETSVSLSISDGINDHKQPDEISLSTKIRPKDGMMIMPKYDGDKFTENYLIKDKYSVMITSNFDIESKDKIEVKLTNEDTENQTIQGFTEVSRAKNKHGVPIIYEYELALDTPDKLSNFAVNANVNGIECSTANIHVPRFSIEYDEADIWATHAKLKIEPEVPADKEIIRNNIDAETIKVFNGGSKTRTNYNKEELAIEIEGLTPCADADNMPTYAVTAGICEKIQTQSESFTTELADQLPESNFDNWSSEKKHTYQYLWTIGSGEVWGTLNNLTAIGGGDACPFSYNKTSGTIPANSRSRYSHKGKKWNDPQGSEGHTDGKEIIDGFVLHKFGTNAALIRTVGWCNGKSGNSAVGTSKGAACDNRTPGELYLGYYDEIDNKPVYGRKFTSRPSSIFFYYHYDVKKSGNGDFGTVELKIYDKSGSIINRGTIINNNDQKEETYIWKLYEQATYKEVTIPIDYIAEAPKAAKIVLIFKSSGNEQALTVGDSFWAYPPFANLSGGEYVGSELYIDDIVLNY